jgi:endonuclease/exonuclease/phosphatase family metal-dependent hydrolase
MFLAHAATTGVAMAGVGYCTASIAEEVPRKKFLRVISYNILECLGWPIEREQAQAARTNGQMADRLAMELALYDPDIITFSESPNETAMKHVAQRLKMHHVRFPSGGQWPGTVLSRFEIVESTNVPFGDGQRPKETFTRHWGRAVVQLAEDQKLVVHSAHLHPAEPGIRVREIDAMLTSMQNDFAANRSMLLMGDMNHVPTMPEYRHWTNAGWIDTFAQVGKGDGDTVYSSVPERRIDYILARGPIAAGIVESRPLFAGAFRTNPADPQSFALSDHLPQLAVFKWPTS